MPDAATTTTPAVDNATPDTKHHRNLGVAVGAGVEAFTEMSGRENYGGFGITNSKWRNYGNATALLVIVVWMSVATPAAFMWLRNDAKDDRSEYRAQVAAERQLAEERRREDRQDRQRSEDLFRSALDSISHDNRETSAQMAKIYEQVKLSTDQMKATSDQMKAASEAMLRVEKLIQAKQPIGPER